MVKAMHVPLLAAALVLTGCIIPQPLTTKTEVVTSADGGQVFGTQALLRFGEQALTLRWDPSTHAYGSQRPAGGFVNALRVARLKGDVYLLQAELEGEEGFFLVPFRVSRTREVTPLACDFGRATAEDFGVRLGSRDAFGLELSGERAGIIGVLASASVNCSPQFQIDTFIPMAGELAKQASSVPGGTTGGCKPCPTGACIQGTITDQTGASVPGAAIRADGAGAAASATVRSDEKGHFFLTGLAAGKVELRVEMTGFSALKIGPIQVKGGLTHLFDEPFELVIASPASETVATPQVPRLCGGTAKSRTR